MTRIYFEHGIGASLLGSEHALLPEALRIFLQLFLAVLQYAGLLVSGRTILHGIANSSLRVDCFSNQYHRVLLGGHTILSGIANNSPKVDCFRNQYRQVYRVTARWAHDFAWHS